MREVDITISLNNKGLKTMFTGTKLKDKKVYLGELNGTLLAQCIHHQLKESNTAYKRFQPIDDSLEIGGEWKKWHISLKIKLLDE